MVLTGLSKPDTCSVSAKDLDNELQAIRKAHEINTVPTFMKRGADGTFVKFDEKIESLSDFISQ